METAGTMEAATGAARTNHGTDHRRTTTLLRLACGCTMKRVDGFGETSLASPFYELEMCPLHRQADDMRRALRVCHAFFRRVLRSGTDSIGLQEIGDAVVDTRDALGRAEGVAPVSRGNGEDRENEENEED